MKHVLATLILLGASAAQSAQGAAPPAEAAACQACHGAHGEGMVDGDKPRLAGQSAFYLDKQLRDFASGARDNAIMSAIAKGLNDQTRASLQRITQRCPFPLRWNTRPRRPHRPSGGINSHWRARKASECRHVTIVMDLMAAELRCQPPRSPANLRLTWPRS